ncbi:neuronal acetylcholine receptor subunit alpha-9-II [Brachyhypopomus gauderio]|uniref:neuronal acetylcholine receptor subunit alpha-9-II n=1 Tax=Brachyhypopomus gauderio TaxID=698409 RepID=UPI0040422D25
MHRMTSFVCFAILFLEVAHCAQGYYAQQLLNDLMENYSNALRPVDDTDATLNVTLQITLSQIKDMDERNQVLIAYLWIRQTWYDAYLKWEKEEYDGLEVIRIPSSLVWRPDLVLYNKADDDLPGPVDTNVVLRYTGEITWDAPAITKSSCVVDVSYFPFDSQQCNLTFGSWTYNGNQVDITMMMDSGELSDYVENVEWECRGMPAAKSVVMYGCCADPYPDITYTLLLKRRSSFYIYNLLLPCFLISFLAPLGFYLPADSGEKVSLGVTVLLALTVFQLVVAESMPPSESVPLIGKYYIATMTMVTASTALTIFIMNIHFCGTEAKPVPHWAKVLIIGYMSRVFFVYEVGESCVSPSVQSEDKDIRPSLSRQQAETPQLQERRGQQRPQANGKPTRPQGSRDSHPVSPIRQPRSPSHRSSSPARQPRSPAHQSQTLPCPHRKREDINYKTGVKDAAPPCCPDDEKPPAAALTFDCCVFCGHPSSGDVLRLISGDRKLVRNVEYIANCFREHRSTSLKVAEWKKVAKVMDRFFMWIFFAMVFLMSILIIGRSS